MNDIYRGLLRRAGGLARQGDPAAATRAIQKALEGSLPKIGSPPGGEWPSKGGPLPGDGSPVSGGDAPWAEIVRRATGAASGTGAAGRRTAHAPRSAPAPSAAPSPAGGRVLRGSSGARHGTRDWRLYEPTAAKRGAPLPLVVMLHGCTQDAEDFARGTRMDAVAEAADAFVLYPEQCSKMNPQRCWNWFKDSHQGIERGEPAIIAGMIAEIAATRPIDPGRVFVAGLSAGGAMAAILGDCAPELFAGVGVHSGLGAGSARDMPSAFAAMQGQGAPVRAPRVPMIVVHGDADPTVSAANAETLVAAAVRDAAGALCRTTPVRANGRECEHTVWSAADGTAVCERWSVGGAGHAWSGGDPSGSYTDATGPDASALMMEFFAACAARPARAA